MPFDLKELECQLGAGVTSVFVSDKFFAQLNHQSCDCEELVLQTHATWILVKHKKVGEEGSMSFDEICGCDREVFCHSLVMDAGECRLEEIVRDGNGRFYYLRFRFGKGYLFLFSLEDGLVLTKSAVDLENMDWDENPDYDETMRFGK